MRIALVSAVVATAALVAGCSSGGGYHGHSHGYVTYESYDYDRPDPRYGYYDPGMYYRDDPRRYHERRMSRDDRIYRGRDGRYYCRRSDGTTGLIVGGITGAALGAAIAPGNSTALGAIIGAAGGAAIGNEIDRGSVRCR
jgi:hypothetical protein